MAKKINTKKLSVANAVYTVDLTDVTCIKDVCDAFIETIIDTMCTPSEVDNFIDKHGVTITFYKCESPKVTKKPNIFKRFWNWLKK